MSISSSADRGGGPPSSAASDASVSPSVASSGRTHTHQYGRPGSGLPRPFRLPPSRLPRRIFVGPVLNSTGPRGMDVIQNALLGVGSGGVIRFLEDLDRPVSGDNDVPDSFLHGASRPTNGEDRAAGGAPERVRQAASEGLMRHEEAVRAGRPRDKSESRSPPFPTAVSALSSSVNPGRPTETVSAPPSRPATASSVRGASSASGVGAGTSSPPLSSPGASSSRSSIEAPSRRFWTGAGPFDAQQERWIRKRVERHGWKLEECRVIRLDSGQFLCPGFVDTHTHACQVPNIGVGQQYELMDWLKNITFPTEKRFEDPMYARRTYSSVVQRLLDSGTTTACYFATLHLEATKILAEVCYEKGQRAFIGKCQMDRNSPLDYVEKNASQSIEDTKELIQFIRGLGHEGSTPGDTSPMDQSSPTLEASLDRLAASMQKTMHVHGMNKEANAVGPSSSAVGGDGSAVITSSAQEKCRGTSTGSHSPTNSVAHHRAPSSSSLSRVAALDGATTSPRWRAHNPDALVQPILTPRFAISCSDALLASISALTNRDPTLRIQTHLSESPAEVDFTKSLFPFATNYTSVYDYYGLMNSRTILAHAIHLDESEMELIKARKCGVSHCPSSNFNLRSGVSRVGEMLDRGIKVGLGTDISGGFGMSMLSAIREASVVAKVLDFETRDANGLLAKTPTVCDSPPGESDGGGDVGNRLPPGPSPLSSAISAEESNGYRSAPFSASESGGITPTAVRSRDSSVARAPADDVQPFAGRPLPVATLFYMATLGGAEVASLPHRIGTLTPGKDFDAILATTYDSTNPNLYIEEDDSIETIFEKWLFCGDDRNMASVYVNGRCVGGSRPILD